MDGGKHSINPTMGAYSLAFSRGTDEAGLFGGAPGAAPTYRRDCNGFCATIYAGSLLASVAGYSAFYLVPWHMQTWVASRARGPATFPQAGGQHKHHLHNSHACRECIELSARICGNPSRGMLLSHVSAVTGPSLREQVCATTPKRCQTSGSGATPG